MRTNSSTLIALLSVALSSAAQMKRPVTPRDCVETKYVLSEDGETAMTINDQGTRMAYMVKSPNIETNENDVALYVQLLSAPQTSARLIATGPKLSELRWMADGKHLAALAPVHGHVGVVLFDSDSGTEEVLASVPEDIEEFSVNNRGDALVYALRAVASTSPAHSNEELAEGYRIPNDASPNLPLTLKSERVPYRLWVQRRGLDGGWKTPTVITLHSPFTAKPLATVRSVSRFELSLSPDGEYLLLNIAGIQMAKGEDPGGSSLPGEWRKSPTYRRRLASGGLIWLTLLQNLRSGQTSMPFPTPSATGLPRWLADSSGFYIVANSPVGSEWELQDEAVYPSPQKPWHLWRIDLPRARTEKLFSNLQHSSSAILWAKNDSVGIRTGAHRITTLTSTSSEWTTQSEFEAGPAESSNYGGLVSNGVITVLDYQRSDTPPELRFYRRGEDQPWTTIKLNPSFSDIQFAPSKTFRWATRDGTGMTGTLVMPPDYVPGNRYPLVIQTKPEQSAFACDAGSDHFPSFAPQPMASQGLVYLSMEAVDRTAHFPTGYPGGIGEAVFYTDAWDSAVKELDRLGIVDPSKVGIIGFSRSGWYTEFALIHGVTRFAAATSTDNVQYSLGEYWLPKSSAFTASPDAMYGGPPYGDTLRNWMKYSISFNEDKIHAPLLMEVMGYGAFDNLSSGSPLNLGVRYEIVTALNRLKKPVELYYYPNEQHQPDHPKARLASIQRNLDWYRFWLQDYERPSPEDPGQYLRWNELRRLRDADSSNPH
jgi:dipeptidyl aminopeptidase/acylaminoacyl peptidase